MSRSAQDEYNKQRTRQSGRKVIAIYKLGIAIPLSDEELFLNLADLDPQYERKTRKTVVAPTSEDWAKYHLAKRALLTLRAYENTIGAEEVEIPCPKPKTEYEYLETVDEWLDRCRALQAERKAA